LTGAVVSRPYASALLEYAGSREDVICLSGDLTTSCEVDLFRDAFPGRFVNVGMAEQNMMGIAGGIARGGLTPFVHTFGVFATRRPFDQVSMAIGVPGLRVRIMGFLPGVTTPGGVTHQAIDDVALMRSVPGMTVVDLGDATEIRTILPELDGVDGPVYCRVMRGDVPVLFDTPIELGKVRALREGSHLLLVSSSIMTQEALRAADTLEHLGVSVAHLHVSTLKPFDAEAVVAVAGRCSGVVTIENHLVSGGLGTAVAEAIAEAGIACPLRRLGLLDTYAAGGSFPYLLERFEMGADAVVHAAAGLLGLEAESNNRLVANRLGEGDRGRQEAL
jgi:transketolase